MRRSHRNPNGHQCQCPWGYTNAEPYVSPKDREVWGTVHASMWHEGSKLEWLRGREDMQDERMRAFLDRLENYLPNHDALYPWLVREHKKDRLHSQNFTPGNYQDVMPFQYTNHQGQREGLEDEDLDMLNRWMKYKKQNKQGVDIMKHEIGHVLPEASRWDAGGDKVWDSDEDDEFDPESYVDGMHIVHLRNRRDLRVEGRRMNHCIGSSTMGYANKLDDGTGLFYSVRDGDNNPMATLEMARKPENYFKCPHCGKFSLGNITFNDAGIREVQCEHCHGRIGTPSDNYPYPTIPDEGVQTFPVDLSKMAKKPDAKFMAPSQFYGRSDNQVPESALEAARHYFGKHGHVGIESSTHDEEEEEDPEPQDLSDLGWDSEYYVGPPDNVEDYLDYSQDHYGYLQNHAPEDYHSADRDADRHGLVNPELAMYGEPDVQNIFEDLAPSRLEDVNPEKIQQIFDAMHSDGLGDEWNNHARTWLNDEYTPFLDPYGSYGGGGGISGSPGNHSRDTIAPSKDNGTPNYYPHLEGWQYPNNYPHEDYFARNLMHHLERTQPIDPQTGEPSRPSDHPAISPNNTTPPQFPKDTVPIPEQTGPTTIPNPVAPWMGPSVLPYGRGEEPSPSVFDERLFDSDDLRTRRFPSRGRGDPAEPKPFEPNSPDLSSPEQYFGPGQEDVRLHQRAFPGMEWRDPTKYLWKRDPNTGEEGYSDRQYPYDPAEPYRYNQGEAQGSLFPNWYIDYSKQRARETDLPEHLFPPEHYGYHQAIPGQTEMWDYSMRPNQTGYYDVNPNINTQTPLPNALEEALQVGNGGEAWNDRPRGDWRANVHNAHEAALWNVRMQPEYQQSPAIQNLEPGHECSFHPGVPATQAGGFAKMCPSCAQRYQEALQATASREAGEWTDYEEANKVNRSNGLGVFDLPPHQGLVFHNGAIVQFNPQDKESIFRMPNFDWRVPVLYHKPTQRLYVGREGMEHGDLARQFSLPSPWKTSLDAHHEVAPGFIDTNGTVGEGGLQFFSGYEPPGGNLFHDWAEQKYGVRAKPKINPPAQPGDIWSSYHPRQDDEWVAEDEPSFSATIPEPRWNVGT